MNELEKMETYANLKYFIFTTKLIQEERKKLAKDVDKMLTKIGITCGELSVNEIGTLEQWIEYLTNKMRK